VAHAQSPDEPAWDGLDRLSAVLREAQIPFSAPNELDLAQISAGDSLLIVSPRQALPVHGLTTFLREGGRVALFDDVGSGDRLLSAYQVGRRPVPAGSAPALRGDPNLLIAYPASEHPLVSGVSLLLTNRASELKHPDLRPVFTFGRSKRALMLAGAVGAGRLVAVGDGSILINQLMSVPSHRRFAQNLIAYLTRPGGRLWLVQPDTSFAGSYGSQPLALSRLDAWFKRLSHPDFPPGVLWLLSVALAGIALVVAGGSLPRRSPYVSPDLFREADVYAGFAGRIAAVEREGLSPLWPLLDYRRELEAELALRLSPGVTQERRELLRAAQARGLSSAQVRELGALLEQLDDLAGEAGGGEPRRQIRMSELRNVVRKGEELLAKLGNDKT
jgi:hypothetical protein